MKFTLIPTSLVKKDGTTYFMVELDPGSQKRLAVQGDSAGFEGSPVKVLEALLYPLTPQNAAVLRQRLPWLQPVPLQIRTSFGFGDRLGLATAGHIRALRETPLEPVFAQQSVRENARTRRTPQQVLDDALWGVFQQGWQAPWGADADHIKDPADLPGFVEAGYSFYTVDPGEHVDHAAHRDPPDRLKQKFADLPWEALQSSPASLAREYLGRTFHLDGFELVFGEPDLLRAAAKYGRALAHAARIYRRLVELIQGRPFDFEVSVDETETPTSIHEHFYLASELRRMGVQWTSLAPRFSGAFEKGVDYIGDLDAFEKELARHVAVMGYFGNYKLSLHSGSDKFSLYPLFAEYTHGRIHVKTAGTSYLEALRVLSRTEPALFREILGFARSRYEIDRATYHVSAHLEKIPPARVLQDSELPGLLEDFDARQVLHVTFGSVLGRFGDQLKERLANHQALYDESLAQHFRRHLASFSAITG